MKQIQLFFFTALALTVFVAIADLGFALAQTNPVKKEEDPNLQRINGRKDPEARVVAPACDSGMCERRAAPAPECGDAPNLVKCIRPDRQETERTKSSPATTAQ